jgi:hypothetical protein
MSELSTESLEASLGAAFGDAPETKAPKAPQAKAPVTAPPVEAEAAPEDELIEEVDPAELLIEEPEAEEEAAPAPEPFFEFELDGKPERIEGEARIKEVLGRGLKAGRGFEEIARVREALAAHGQQMQLNTQFQQAMSQDIASLQALDNQLQQYQRLDWSQQYDTDPLNALKLKAQRDQLMEQRAAVVQGLQSKQQQFQVAFQQNTNQVLAAEYEALLAKVPTWRNAEKAKQERGEIAGALTSHYGFSPAEVGNLMDHRMLLVARDAAAYRKLLANKDARVKQVREAPATAKPGSAQAQSNGRAEFNKVRGKIKELGTKGQHRAQEDLMTRVLGVAFK